MQNLLKSTVLALSFGVCCAAFAQAPAPTPAPQTSEVATHKAANPAHQTKELSKKLGLTADQAAKIEPVLADRDQRIAALQANTSLDPKSMKQQRRAIMMDTQSKLNAVLTPAQQQQLATLKAGKHGGGASQTAAPPPPPAI